MTSLCPSDKILNPKTKRCVKKSGRIGRSLSPKRYIEDKKETCPSDKILNPKTKRCVKKSGRIGRSLSPKRYIEDKKETCPPDKILNPKTKRCVKKSGRIGKQLLKQNYISIPYMLPEESEDELESIIDNDENYILEPEEELISGSREFYYYAMKYLNEKYNECFLKTKDIMNLSMDDYELIWEDKPEKETVLKDAKDSNLKLYGNRYAYFVDKKYRPNLKDIDGLLYVNKKVTEDIMKCMKGKSRFIILSLSVNKLFKQNGVLGAMPHANILIYDKKNSTLERYEPHGPAYNFIGKKSQKLMDDDITEYFMDIGLIKTRIDYYAPINFCPKWDKWQQGRTGHQMIQNLESKEFSGSCATWCMWYIDERLENPDRSRDKVIQESIEEMQSSSKGFTKFIKKYFQIIKDYRNKK